MSVLRLEVLARNSLLCEGFMMPMSTWRLPRWVSRTDVISKVSEGLYVGASTSGGVGGSGRTAAAGAVWANAGAAESVAASGNSRIGKDGERAMARRTCISG